ncbi:hypothetical protein AVEN_88809-1, partial [Araneus ventricosus]
MAQASLPPRALITVKFTLIKKLKTQDTHTEKTAKGRNNCYEKLDR